MEGLMKKRYEMAELNRSNIFLKVCNSIEQISSFDTRNSFMFYRAMMEKFGVKLSFITFQ